MKMHFYVWSIHTHLVSSIDLGFSGRSVFVFVFVFFCLFVFCLFFFFVPVV